MAMAGANFSFSLFKCKETTPSHSSSLFTFNLPTCKKTFTSTPNRTVFSKRKDFLRRNSSSIGGRHYVLSGRTHSRNLATCAFALVLWKAGKHDETFVTHSVGRFPEDPDTAQDLPTTGHAMYSLKANMRWDEDVDYFYLFSRKYFSKHF
ncbi:hypothetical protein IFM89_029265 [Coptis chinensis]|uniref:Uncharacterized protein n=1 Tax=Coptis chinensis TaxID=261450 RepID=A0A835H1K1_9MAGN|nr:hypothetical protein IFM89_029265 [Coptis chinensis]